MSYQLAIAEKPSVAQAIGRALGATTRKDGYLEGAGFLISWCVGHLVELADASAYDERYRTWQREDLPILPERWRYTARPDKQKQLGVLKRLMHRPDVETVVNCCDAGREGEHIHRLVYEHCGYRKPVRRLWISSMEDAAIRQGFQTLRPGEEYDNLYRAALCRAQADWLVGVNYTRLYSTMYHTTLNIGRVMTPTLALLVQREADIAAFQKEPFYTVELDCGGFAAASGRMGDRVAAERIRGACEGQPAVVRSVEKQEKTEAPPRLFDLTSLQREANRLLGFTAQQTLDYAQGLYEKKLLTYPRTDSRYLTEDMRGAAESIVNWLRGHMPFAQGTSFTPDIGRVINNSKVNDHHALVPIMELAETDLDSLPAGERDVLMLIAARLLCATGQPLSPVSAAVKEGCASPPKHYTEDLLLSAMESAGAQEMPEDAERKGLGTPATRAATLEKLIRSGFLKRDKRRLLPTAKGVNLIAILPEAVKSPRLTAEWEHRLMGVQRDEASAAGFMAGIAEMVRTLVREHPAPDPAHAGLFAAPKGETVGQCPRCGKAVCEAKRGFFCIDRACGFALWKDNRFFTSKKKPLDTKTAAALLAEGRVFLSGLHSPKTGRSYDAIVVMDPGAKGNKYVNFKLEFASGKK